jgi:hypothetical protein
MSEQETDSSEPTIQQQLVRVMASVGAIGKQRAAPEAMGGYRFRGIDDVLNALHPALVEHRVVVLPRVLERTVEPLGKRRLVSLLVEYRFVGPAGDELICSAWGEGADTQDKASGKAMSTAMKSAMFQALSIPIVGTSVDVEAERPFQEQAPAAPVALSEEEEAMLAELAHRFAALDEDRSARLRDWLEDPRQVGAPVGDALEDLPPRMFSKVEELLEKAEAQAVEASVEEAAARAARVARAEEDF